MKRQSFAVTVPVVNGVSQRDMAAYIRDAVQNWSGQFQPPGHPEPDSPGDPLFVAIYRNKKSVTVRRAG